MDNLTWETSNQKWTIQIENKATFGEENQNENKKQKTKNETGSSSFKRPYRVWYMVMMVNATFNNTSAILLWSVLLVEETILFVFPLLFTVSDYSIGVFILFFDYILYVCHFPLTLLYTTWFVILHCIHVTTNCSCFCHVIFT
jgi:hypothetical protein